MCRLFLDDTRISVVENINPYLFDAPNALIASRSKPLCNVPKMLLGNKPADGGNLILTEEDKERIIQKEPKLKKYIKPYVGAVEYINKKNVTVYG